MIVWRIAATLAIWIVLAVEGSLNPLDPVLAAVRGPWSCSKTHLVYNVRALGLEQIKSSIVTYPVDFVSR